MRQLHVLRLAVLALACVSAGCSLPVGEGSKTDPANGTGSVKNWAFTVTPSKNNFTLETGTTDTTVLTLTRTGGFTGPIAIEVFTAGGPDGAVAITTEPVTQTGAVTTSRIITKIFGGHIAVSNYVLSVHAQPASEEVQGQFLDLTFNIVKKPGIFITVPAALSVGRGQAVGALVTFTRTSFDAAVPMNLVGAPVGVTATFNPNPVTDVSTQMTIFADASVAEGVYNVGVRGNEGLSGQGTAPLALTVVAPGTFTLSPSTLTLAVPKNSTVPMSIAINRTNFSGPVTFSFSGVPGGVTATFTTNAVTGNSVQLSFTNSGTGVPGQYPIVITATAVGLPSVQFTLNLSVS